MNFQNWNNGAGRRMGNGRMRNRGNRGRNGRPWRASFQPRFANSWVNPRHQGYFNGPLNPPFPPEGVQNFYNPQHRQFLSPPPLRKPPSRPQSPLPGSEEYTQRNIQQASELIKRQLNLDCSSSVVNSTSVVSDTSCDEVNNSSKNKELKLDTELVQKVVKNRKINSVKTKQVSEFDVKEIHQKIVNHISNLSHGRKMNLVNKASSGYDEVIQHIQKQKRLELSRVLRDMCKRKIEEKDNKVIDAIVPDMGIKIEDFPSEVISELSNILGVDFDDKVHNSMIDPEKCFLQAQELLNDDDFRSFEGFMESQDNSQPSSSNSNYFPHFNIKTDEDFTTDFNLGFNCSFPPPKTTVNNQPQLKKIKLKWSPFNKPERIDENKNNSNLNFWHKPSVYEPEEELDFNCQASPELIKDTTTTTDKIMEMSLKNLQFTIENNHIKIPDINLDLSKLSSTDYQIPFEDLDSPVIQKENPGEIEPVAENPLNSILFPAPSEEASREELFGTISTPEGSISSIKTPQNTKIDSPIKETNENYHKNDDLFGYISTTESSLSSFQKNNETPQKIEEDSFLLSKSSFEDFETNKEMIPSDIVQNGTVESKPILEPVEMKIIDSEIVEAQKASETNKDTATAIIATEKSENSDEKFPRIDKNKAAEVSTSNLNTFKTKTQQIKTGNKETSSDSKTKESKDKRHHHEKKKDTRHEKREIKDETHRKHSQKHKRRHESKQKRTVSSYTQFDPDVFKRTNKSTQVTWNHQKNSVSTQVLADCFIKSKANQATQVFQDCFEKTKQNHQATQVFENCFEKAKDYQLDVKKRFVERLRKIDAEIMLLLQQKESIYEELTVATETIASSSVENKTKPPENPPNSNNLSINVPTKRKSPEIHSISNPFSANVPNKTKSFDNFSVTNSFRVQNKTNAPDSVSNNSLNINIPLKSINEFNREDMPSTSGKLLEKKDLEKIGIKMSFKRTKKRKESDNLVQQTIDYVVKKFTSEDTNGSRVEIAKDDSNEWCVSKMNLNDRKANKRPHSDSEETKAIQSMPTKASKKFFKPDTEDVFINRTIDNKKRLKIESDDSDSDTNSIKRTVNSMEALKNCSVSLRRYNITDLNDIKTRLKQKSFETRCSSTSSNETKIIEPDLQSEIDARGNNLDKMTPSTDSMDKNSCVEEVSPCSLVNHSSLVDNVLDDISIISDLQDEVYEKDFGDFVGSILVVKVVSSIVLAASDLGKIYCFDLCTGVLLHVISVSNKAITSVCMIKNDLASIFVGSLDGMLNVFNFNTKEISKTIQIEDGVQCMEYAWDYIFIGSHRGFIIRYAVKTGKIEDSVKVAESNVLVIKAAPEGARRILLVASRKAPVSIRDAMSGLLMREFDPKIFPTVYTLLLENNLVYCGTSQHDILVYTFQNGELVYRHEATNSKGVACMKIVGNLLFAGCYNGKIYVYNLKSKVHLGTMNGPGGLLLCMTIDKNKIIVGTKTNKLKAWTIPEKFLKRQ